MNFGRARIRDQGKQQVLNTTNTHTHNKAQQAPQAPHHRPAMCTNAATDINNALHECAAGADGAPTILLEFSPYMN
jgi:hypothetical protein